MVPTTLSGDEVSRFIVRATIPATVESLGLVPLTVSFVYAPRLDGARWGLADYEGYEWGPVVSRDGEALLAAYELRENL